jgi:hypothetical protein
MPSIHRWSVLPALEPGVSKCLSQSPKAIRGFWSRWSVYGAEPNICLNSACKSLNPQAFEALKIHAAMRHDQITGFSLLKIHDIAHGKSSSTQETRREQETYVIYL